MLQLLRGGAARRGLALAGTALVAPFLATRLFHTEVPLSHRERFYLPDGSVDALLGYLLLRKLRRTTVLPPDDERCIAVRAIGGELAAAAQSLGALSSPSSLTDGRWHFHVTDSPFENAYSGGGGVVIVERGALDAIYAAAASPADAQDKLARLLSHEVAHVCCRHQAEKLVAVVPPALLLSSAMLFAPVPGALAALAYVLLIELPLSRAREKEADGLGVVLLDAAGYDARAGIAVLSTRDTVVTLRDTLPHPLGAFLDSWGSRSPAIDLLSTHLPVWVSTHPGDAERAEAAEAQFEVWERLKH